MGFFHVIRNICVLTKHNFEFLHFDKGYSIKTSQYKKYKLTNTLNLEKKLTKKIVNTFSTASILIYNENWNA